MTRGVRAWTTFATIAFAAGNCSAQPQVALSAATHARRIALVIGNKDYARADWTLTNPINDANAIGAALAAVGFELHVVLNGTLGQMQRAVSDLAGSIQSGDVVVFYYAGHGVQLQGENFLIPTDFAAEDEASARAASFNVEVLRETLESKPSRLRIIILDTCRNNPFRPRSIGNSLTDMMFGKGTYLALATGPGAIASDGGDRRNGLFTSFLIDEIRAPGRSLQEIFARVRTKVDEVTKGNQRPHVMDGVIGTFYFVPPAGWVEPDPPALNVPAATEKPRRIRVVATPENVTLAAKTLASGRLALESKHYSEALPLLERAAELNPLSAETYRLLGRARYILRDFFKAAQALSEAIEIGPQGPELYRDRALCHSEMRNYVEAISDLSRAIALNPKDAQSFWARSQARDAIGDHLGSLEDDKVAKQLRRDARDSSRATK